MPSREQWLWIYINVLLHGLLLLRFLFCFSAKKSCFLVHSHQLRAKMASASFVQGASSAVICSICLEVVSETCGRTPVKLRCSHSFHLDCIGSAFNMKGIMECPNCREIEAGVWKLFENQDPSAAFEDLSSDDMESELERCLYLRLRRQMTIPGYLNAVQRMSENPEGINELWNSSHTVVGDVSSSISLFNNVIHSPHNQDRHASTLDNNVHPAPTQVSGPISHRPEIPNLNLDPLVHQTSVNGHIDLNAPERSPNPFARIVCNRADHSQGENSSAPCAVQVMDQQVRNGAPTSRSVGLMISCTRRPFEGGAWAQERFGASHVHVHQVSHNNSGQGQGQGQEQGQVGPQMSNQNPHQGPLLLHNAQGGFNLVVPPYPPEVRESLPRHFFDLNR